MYIKRTIENSISEFSKIFPVVYIGGPRQVGKTTVFEEFCKKYGRGHGKAWIKEKIFYRYKPDFVSNIHPGKGRSFRISDGLAAEWFAKHEKEIDWDEPLERDK